VAWLDQPTVALADGDSAPALINPGDDPLIGVELGNYLVEAFLGQGGMARVYRAKHLTLERPCALKVMRDSLAGDDPTAVDSFLAEARAAAALVHPHVVTLHTIGHDEELHYIEMEYVDGVSLASLLATSGPLEATQATRFMVQVSSALAEAHTMGMIHRDIKPANVMVTRDGRAKLADFGLAKRLVSTLKSEKGGFLVGTPHYMAPELFRGDAATRRSDVYAMGVTFYALLTARLPFKCDTLSEMLRFHSSHSVVDISDVEQIGGEAAQHLIARCLTHDPRSRYSDAVELHSEFQSLYGSLRSLGSLLREALAGSDVSLVGERDRYVIAVPLANGRSQKVYVEVHRGSAVSQQVIEIFSICGPVSERYYRRALELNSEIPFGAIAIQEVDGIPHFVMSNTYPRATCDPEEVRQSVFAIAKHADEVENLLTGRDTH
jgi:serine/threonine-protein kinase